MTKFPSKQELKKMSKKHSKGMASLPLPEHAEIGEKIKHAICQKFVIYKNDHDIHQNEMAKIIGIDEALMSKILHYHYEDFTIDRLIRYLSVLYEKIEIHLDVA